ncbi:MAG: alginate export family protein [Proteobacteria bacterium]|nr:alginate export family protein [Pseudomonadota bacterium]
MSRNHCLLASAIALAFSQVAAFAQSAPDGAAQSKPIVEVRYRYEGVGDDAFTRDADANTVRLRLGYRWEFAPGWRAVVSADRVQALAGAHYNSTANGKTQYPTVADPQSSEFHEAYVGYASGGLDAALGRQIVAFDNQRFFGNSGWRQNEQTFDAFSARYAFDGGGPVVRYAYLDRVQRVFGNANPNPLLRAWDLNANLLNVAQALPLGTLVGYAYFVRNDTVATASTRTFGARWTGAQAAGEVKFGWTLEYARQDDYANNPASQSASYRLIEPTLTWRGVTFKAGDEVMGGNGHYGFATPFATLHAFDGWADRFLTTPVDGIDDRYLGASGNLGKAVWTTTWHDFHADRGGRAYGTEFDAMLTYPLARGLTGLLKLADYRSDGFSTDERKLWASIEYKF